MRRLGYLGISVLIVAADQVTKAVLKRSIGLYEDRVLIPGLLSLRHGHNPGIAFGVLSAGTMPRQAIILTAASLAGLLFVAVYAARLPLSWRLHQWALALILGGAAGNLVDRLRYGYVVDFVHLYWRGWQWPDFNLADSCISVGVALLLLAFLREDRAPEPLA